MGQPAQDLPAGDWPPGYPGGLAWRRDEQITENRISGTGYLNHPTCTTAQPYVTYRIDTTGSLDPLVIFNS